MTLEADYLTACEELAAARNAQAVAFVRFKASTAVTATQAMQQAIAETGSALDVAEGRAEVARLRLVRESCRCTGRIRSDDVLKAPGSYGGGS